mgnify:CR=1 FL=1
MRTDRIILAGLALTALVACNKDAAPTDGGVFQADEAYMNIRIAYADKGLATRGTGSDTNPFYYGTADENSVTSADFFFYNADGSYVTHVNQAATGAANGVDSATGDNIEWKGDGTIVLKGLKSKNYPKYMSVILNADATFTATLERLSLSDARKKTIEAIATVGTKTQADWTKFVMASSTYDNADGNSGYFCTQLIADNFQENIDDATANPVIAYVERLAAKVKVDLNGAFAGTDMTKIGSFHVNATATTTDLYAKVTGWGLNATTKDDYVYKMINTGFGNFTWNDTENHRSYWGLSTNYGAGVYPLNYRAYDAVTATLNYVSYNSLEVEPEKAAYCRENTQIQSVLEKNNFNSTVTCVLLRTLITDVDGNPISIALYDGTLYEEEVYKDRILEKYNRLAPTTVPYVSSDGVTFTQVDKSYFEYENIGDGLVYLKFKTLTDPEKYYRHTDSGTTAADFTAITADGATNLLNGSDPTSVKNTMCSFYRNGMMYYSIPIEHLGNTGSFKDDSYKFPEGDYGVVRNHFYNLTINKIENIGSAVFDPDEIIIPNDEDNTNYNVGAQINILSWKVVDQTVNL